MRRRCGESALHTIDGEAPMLIYSADVARIISIDPGISKEFMAHRVWLGANKSAFENVANAERLPARGDALRHTGQDWGRAAAPPTRVFALLP